MYQMIETEHETWKSQMYGHNAGWPVASLYTKYYHTCDNKQIKNPVNLKREAYRVV